MSNVLAKMDGGETPEIAGKLFPAFSRHLIVLPDFKDGWEQNLGPYLKEFLESSKEDVHFALEKEQNNFGTVIHCILSFPTLHEVDLQKVQKFIEDLQRDFYFTLVEATENYNLEEDLETKTAGVHTERQKLQYEYAKIAHGKNALQKYRDMIDFFQKNPEENAVIIESLEHQYQGLLDFQEKNEALFAEFQKDMYKKLLISTTSVNIEPVSTLEVNTDVLSCGHQVLDTINSLIPDEKVENVNKKNKSNIRRYQGVQVIKQKPKPAEENTETTQKFVHSFTPDCEIIFPSQEDGKVYDALFVFPNGDKQSFGDLDVSYKMFAYHLDQIGEKGQGYKAKILCITDEEVENREYYVLDGDTYKSIRVQNLEIGPEDRCYSFQFNDFGEIESFLIKNKDETIIFVERRKNILVERNFGHKNIFNVSNISYKDGRFDNIDYKYGNQQQAFIRDGRDVVEQYIGTNTLDAFRFETQYEDLLFYTDSRGFRKGLQKVDGGYIDFTMDGVEGDIHIEIEKTSDDNNRVLLGKFFVYDDRLEDIIKKHDVVKKQELCDYSCYFYYFDGRYVLLTEKNIEITKSYFDENYVSLRYDKEDGNGIFMLIYDGNEYTEMYDPRTKESLPFEYLPRITSTDDSKMIEGKSNNKIFYIEDDIVYYLCYSSRSIEKIQFIYRDKNNAPIVFTYEDNIGRSGLGVYENHEWTFISAEMGREFVDVVLGKNGTLKSFGEKNQKGKVKKYAKNIIFKGFSRAI